MKNFLLLVLFVVKVGCCYADEPPSWTPYKSISENGAYFAWVDFADTDTLIDSSDRTWNLTVYDKDSTMIWKKNIIFSDSGNITNNGNYFVVVEDWYYENSRVVDIYCRDSDDYHFKGKDFAVSSFFLKETESHQLWVKDYQLENNRIMIETVDDKIWEINFETQKLILKKQNNSVTFGIIGMIVLLAIIMYSYVMKK